MTMNDDIDNFGVYGLTHNGQLVRVPVFSTADYNHSTHQLHHYIKQQEYKRNKQWFEDRGIKQKLFLIPKWLHLIVHNSPDGAQLTDEKFIERFKVSRYELLFNRKKWREGYYG